MGLDLGSALLLARPCLVHAAATAAGRGVMAVSVGVLISAVAFDLIDGAYRPGGVPVAFVLSKAGD